MSEMTGKQVNCDGISVKVGRSPQIKVNMQESKRNALENKLTFGYSVYTIQGIKMIHSKAK